MKKHKIAELVQDFDLYPRGSVDAQHAGEIAAAIEAGAEMPPIVVEQKTLRIVDGFHRLKAYQRLFGEEHVVECIEKSYQSEGELFLDAMRYNAGHGRALSNHDKVHCMLIAERLQIQAELVATALHMTPARITGLRASRIGTFGNQAFALKQTIRHKAGQELTEGQVEANTKLGGMNQLYFANQLILLIENDLVDWENAELMNGLERLNMMLNGLVKAKKAKRA